MPSLRDLLPPLVLSLGLPLLALVPLAVSRASAAPGDDSSLEARAGHYAVDGLHSSALFRINHLGVAEFYGTFNELGGSYDLDLDEPSRSSILLAIEPRSVDTRHPGRDAHVLNADFLDVENHPDMTFRSTKVDAGSARGRFAVTGELSLRGVTRTITFEARLTGAAATRMGYRSGLHAEFEVDRFDYDMSALPETSLGRKIGFIVSLEGVLQERDG